ncbi:hypothetical protein ACIGH6_11995 [Brachybacterium paraconglomeratum]|uniref:hypothetical protein n=1 Tax=Brachybacterium paraconglomeratum TaxID=173362 RepID=UPI0037C74C66
MSQPRSRTPLVLGIIGGVACLGLVLVLVLGGIVGFLVLREGSEPGSGTATEAGPAEARAARRAPARSWHRPGRRPTSPISSSAPATTAP